MALSHYNYTPSLDAAIVVAVLYSLAFALTLSLWVRYRAWVWVVMVVASASKFLLSVLWERDRQSLDPRLTRPFCSGVHGIYRAIHLNPECDQ